MPNVGGNPSGYGTGSSRSPRAWPAGRRVRLHLKKDAPFAQLVLTGATTLPDSPRPDRSILPPRPASCHTPMPESTPDGHRGAVTTGRRSQIKIEARLLARPVDDGM